MTTTLIEALLENAILFRADSFDERREKAFRLFNGFNEGNPDLVVDLYGRTVVLHNYADKPESGLGFVRDTQRYLLQRLPWIQAIIVKTRNSNDQTARRGFLVYGSAVDRKIREDGIWYAIDPMLNRDASFYLDTRNVRNWATRCLEGKSVLNTFAYTGSLGVAAHAGGARRVVHLELNRSFLNVAKTSYTLNGFAIKRNDFIAGDFWPQINRLKKTGERFDCVFLDPPIYSATSKGVVDLARSYSRLVNKVRPLINHDGHLVAINNALFVSGAAYLAEIQSLCDDGYLSIEELIPVPSDFVGSHKDQHPEGGAETAPFNHSTKIAVLRVRRKA